MKMKKMLRSLIMLAIVVGVSSMAFGLITSVDAGPDQEVQLADASTTGVQLDSSFTEQGKAENITNYSWSGGFDDIDDNNTATADDPIVTFIARGVYVLALDVTGDEGSTPSDTVTITVVGPPLWDRGAGTDDWHTAANWDPDGVPSSTEDAIFNITAVVDIDAAAFAYDLNVEDGGVVTLTGINGIPTLTLTNDLNVAFGDPESDITASMVIKDINVIGGIAKKLVVGHRSGSGSGTLTFESDTTATSEFDGKVRIGRGTTGTLNVKAGAILKLQTTASSNSSEFQVGHNGGTGTINIFDGGTLEYGAQL